MARKKQGSRARAGVVAGAAAAALLAFPGAASAAVNSSVAGGVLTVSSTADDPIAITCETNQVKVNAQDPGTGAAACDAITAIDVDGGPGANAISLVGVTAAAFPNVSSVTIDGAGGNDTITGSEFDDTMLGGEGNDRIVGDNNPAGTRDDAQGQGGDDTMVWNPGDGDDVNEGGDGSDTIEVNGGNGGEQFVVKPSTTAGRIQFDRTGPTPPGPFNLDIGTSERLDMNANGGDDTFAAESGFALSFVLDVDGGEGNDSLDGGDGADLLAGGNGNDRIAGDNNPAGTRDDAQGQGGDDTMVWNPGDGDDVNEGGDGNDTTEVNGGNGPEQFQVKPSAIAGRVQFDRTGPTPPGPFNVDIGTTENLRLNAAGGDDRIRGAKGLAGLIASTFNGDDGNDRITGTDGEDQLAGGKGSDLINAVDRAEDAVECGGGPDLAFVDRRDRVRGCELVLGGKLQVALVGKARLAGEHAVLRLRCVGSARCEGTARLRRGGKTLGSKRFELVRGKTRTVRVALNARGRRVLAGASGKQLRIKVRIDSRDAHGNGWRSTARVTL